MAIIKPGQSNPDKMNSKQRVSEKIKQRLDFQIKGEAEAAQIYRAMAQWCEFKGYFGAAKFLNYHAEEEMDHMKRVQKYCLERNCLPVTPQMIKPAQDFQDLIDVIRKALEHEKKVSQTYEEFAKLCLEEQDFTTFTWVQWFLKEQVEEENLYSNMLDKIEMMKSEGVGMLEIEGEITKSSLTGEINKNYE